MSRLKYHQLLYFWTVAREGSVARATRVLHLAQPTVSGQIHALERTLGERLFVRSGRGLVLTEVGKVVYRYAEEIFALGNEMVQTVQGMPTGRPLRFAVGISDSLPKLSTLHLLRPALEGPQPLRPIFRTDKTARLLGDLSTHALDLVLSDAPAPPTAAVRVHSRLLADSEVTVFAAPALAARIREGFPGSLNGVPFLLQMENTALRHSLDSWFAASGVVPQVAAEVEDMALLQVLGQDGMGAFAAPTLVEAQVQRAYGVEAVGRLAGVRERFYLVSVERRLTHPAVLRMLAAAPAGSREGAAPAEM